MDILYTYSNATGIIIIIYLAGSTVVLMFKLFSCCKSYSTTRDDYNEHSILYVSADYVVTLHFIYMQHSLTYTDNAISVFIFDYCFV